MKLKTLVLLITTHGLVGALGFALGIYALPILTAPPAPEQAEIQAKSSQAMFTGVFRRDLEDSDRLHWGEGELSVGPDFITLTGKLAPGPDYKLYLSPEFVETEADFQRLKPTLVRVGDVRTLENFVVNIPEGINPADHTTVIVWCESFGQFITAAQYR